MVKRYDPMHGDEKILYAFTMKEDELGEYVRASDWDDLIEKIEVLTKELNQPGYSQSLVRDQQIYDAGVREASNKLKRLIYEAKNG